MKASDFVSSSGYLRTLEKHLLSTSAIDRIVDASDAQEALRMITQLSEYDFNSLKRLEDYEDVLKKELRRIYLLARSLTNHSCVVDIPACKYDYHNLKAAVKAKYFPQRTPSPFVYATDTSPQLLEKVVNGDIDPAKSDLPLHLQSAAVAAVAAFEKENSPQSIDITLDLLMLAHMKELSDKTGNDFIADYVKNLIDFYNLKTLMRVKDTQKGSAVLSKCLAEGGHTEPSFFIQNYGRTLSAMVPVFHFRNFGEAMRLGMEEFDRTGNYSQLERLLDNYLIDQLKQAKYISYGPEVLFAYILNKENEIRQIRILVTCKHNGIKTEALRERLRDNYA